MGDKKTEKQVFENLSLSDLATMFIDVILDGQDKFQNPIERPDGSWGLQSPIVQNPDSSQIPARVDGFKITTPIEFVDQFLTFYWGPASAAADVATEDDNWKQIINIPAVAGAVGEKYANAYHILMTRVAGVELSKTALTIARAVKIPGQVGLLILWGEIWYEGGGWVDKKVNASGWIVGKLPDPVGLDPSEYPLATIYKYIEQDAMIPYLVAKEIKEGLEKQGRGWPTFEEYPLYLRQHITERNIALFRDFLTWSIESAARAEEWLDIGETSEPKIIEENADQPPEPSDGLHQQGVTIAAGEEQACYAQDPTLEAPNPAADSQETAAGEEQACYAQDPTLEAPNPAADSQETAAGEEQACYAQDPTLEAPNPAADNQETAAGEEQACYAQDPTLEAPNPAADSQDEQVSYADDVTTAANSFSSDSEEKKEKKEKEEGEKEEQAQAEKQEVASEQAQAEQQEAARQYAQAQQQEAARQQAQEQAAAAQQVR